jgi:hypothetical protein
MRKGKLVDDGGLWKVAWSFVTVLGIGLFFHAIVIMAPLILPYLVSAPFSTSQELFSNSPGSLGIVVDVPQQVRPGSEFEIRVRGASRQDWSSSAAITHSVRALNVLFVQQVDPESKVAIASGSAWLLPGQSFAVRTLNPQAPPPLVELEILQVLTSEGKPEVSISDKVTIAVDRIPFPLQSIIQTIVGVVTFLVGAFGSRLIGPAK